MMRLIPALLLLMVANLLLVPVPPSIGGETLTASELKKGAYTTLSYQATSGDTVHYHVYVPSAYLPTARLPLLLEVHGAGPQVVKEGGGGSARRYLGLNPAYSEEKYPCIFVEPLVNPAWKTTCWDGRGWGTGSHRHDLQAPPKGIALLLELLPKLIVDLGSDPDRTYVVGASNGGYATWDLITYRPDLFAAAVPICGAGDPSHAKRIADLPIWTFHGTADKTVPFKGTTDMVEAITAAGGTRLKHTYFDGAGHKTWDMAWQTPELVPWLFSQRRTAVLKKPGDGR